LLRSKIADRKSSSRPLKGWRLWLAVILFSVFTLSLLALMSITFFGGITLKAKGLKLFSVKDYDRPLGLCLFTLAGIFFLVGKKRVSAALRRFPLLNWCFFLLMGLVAVRGLIGVTHIFGDGLEYTVQTQAIVLNRQLKIDREAISDYWNRTNPYGKELSVLPAISIDLRESSQARGGFGGLYPDRFGEYHYSHFWIYSLVVAPLYALLHAIFPGGGLEYQAFRIMNVIFLCTPFLVAWGTRGSWPRLIISALILASPLLPLTDWQHSELFCFCFIFLAFQAVKSKRFRFFGPLLLGAAAGQVLPIILFFPVHLFYRLTYSRPEGKRRPDGKIFLSYLLGGLLALSSVLYYWYYFGVFSVLGAVGLASPEYASIKRALHFFLSPMIGGFWLFPTCFLFLPAIIGKKNYLFVLGTLFSVAGAAWMASATDNLNAGQVGSSRHLIWLLAPLWYIVLNRDWGIRKLRKDGRSILFYLALAINMGLIIYFRSHLLIRKDIGKFATCRRAVEEVAAFHRLIPYHDDVEIMVENITGQEMFFRLGSFNGIYIWNLGDNRSIWIISRRALRNLRRLNWEEKRIPRYRVSPENNTVFREENGTITLSPDKINKFCRHPLAGDYVLVRVNRTVGRISSNVPVFVR